MMKIKKTLQQHELQCQKKKSKAAISLLKYKSRSELLIEEYQEPNVGDDRMYVIDKVVRMRGLQGRFGVDHSEILNYEFEQANKQRYDHMNHLVYKNVS